MSFTPYELTLVALSILVDHDAIADLVVFEPTLEGPALMETIVPYRLLVVLPLSTELISVPITVHPFSISFPILYATLVVLSL